MTSPPRLVIGNVSESREYTPSTLPPFVTQQEHEDSPPMQPSLNQSSGAASCSTIKKGRGKYKCISVDLKTKHGRKIIINIPEDFEQAVRDGAREFSNYYSLVVRTSCLFRNGDWPAQQEKYGDIMWLKVKSVG